MPPYADSDTRFRLTFRLAFDRFDLGFIGLLTLCLIAALTIGAASFSLPALVFLLAMNAASLAVGRALLTLQVGAYRLFAEYILGFAVCSLIVFGVCRIGILSAGVGGGAAAAAGLAAAAYCCTGRRRCCGGTADLLAGLLVCACAFIWSWQAIIAVPHLHATGVFDAWSDYAIHAGEVAQFAQFGALRGTSMFASGAGLPLYHYGSYMAAAALCGVTGLPALVCATVFWTLLGFLLLGLGAVMLGGVLAGEAGGVLALIVLLLLPDPAHTWPRNRFFDYHWLMQIAASGCYATALACLAIAAMVFWLRGRRTADLAWAVILSAAVFEFRVHVFAALAVTNTLLFLFAWRPAKWWLRPLLVAAGVALVAGVLLLLGRFPRAPHFFTAAHHPIQQMAQMLAMPPNPYEHLYPRLIGALAPHGVVVHALWLAVVALAGYVLVALAAFGALLPVYVICLAWLIRRGRAAAADYVPLAAVTAYGLIIALFPDTPMEPMEFAHRPFVVPYALLAMWCGRYALAVLDLWVRPAWRWRTGLAAGAVLLAVPLTFERSAQCSALRWSYLYCRVPAPLALIAAADFVRTHARPGDIVAVPAGPYDELFLGLSERPAFSPGTIYLTIQSGLSPEQAARRIADQANAMSSGADAAALGIKWIVSFPGAAPAGAAPAGAAPAGAAVFDDGGYQVRAVAGASAG